MCSLEVKRSSRVGNNGLLEQSSSDHNPAAPDRRKSSFSPLSGSAHVNLRSRVSRQLIQTSFPQEAELRDPSTSPSPSVWPSPLQLQTRKLQGPAPLWPMWLLGCHCSRKASAPPDPCPCPRPRLALHLARLRSGGPRTGYHHLTCAPETAQSRKLASRHPHNSTS